MDALAIALRFGTYGVLALIAGVPFFLWLSLGPSRGGALFKGMRGGYVTLLVIGASLSLFAVVAATATMAGTPLLPVDWAMVSIILSATASAKAMLARAVILLLAIPLALTGRLHATALLGLGAAATLAWSGHAAGDEGMAGWLHFLADIAHILAAVLWIGGMACLLLSLRRAEEGATLPMLRAFAPIGSIAVTMLLITGIVNGVMILGSVTLPGLLSTIYGRLLAFKVTAFFTMLLLAANNRFRLTPAFEAQTANAGARLNRAVMVEIGLAFLILLLVGWLGMIDPSAPA